MRVRDLNDEDSTWKEEALRRVWGATEVARKGELVDAARLPGLVAVEGDDPLGLLTYSVRADAMEIVTIQAEHEGRGIGRALMDAALARATQLGVRRIWLTTTNNNFRAFRFYQAWGMDLAAFIREGVAVSRRVKPIIPAIDAAGVPVRHELEFERRLD